MKECDARLPDPSERGFTLVETLIAMVVLTFGLIAITNLLLVAASSNTVANHSTAAAAEASAVMEKLKAIPYTALVPGGDLDNDVPGTVCDADATDCVTNARYNLTRTIQGVGRIRVRWALTNTGIAGPDTTFIQVRAWSEAPLAGARSRTELTTFRACTLSPPCP